MKNLYEKIMQVLHDVATEEMIYKETFAKATKIPGERDNIVVLWGRTARKIKDKNSPQIDIQGLKKEIVGLRDLFVDGHGKKPPSKASIVRRLRKLQDLLDPQR